MASDIFERLQRRGEELNSQEAELQARMADIIRERREIEIALRVYRNVAPDLFEEANRRSLAELLGDDDEDQREGPPEGHTFKSLAAQILRQNWPNGMQAADIREVARQSYDCDINPNTLTVVLGRLKEAGDVRNEGRTWFFVRRESVFEEGTPGAQRTGGIFE